MKRIRLAVLGLMTFSAGADAQSTAQTIDRALLAAPARAREDATVISWNADPHVSDPQTGHERVGLLRPVRRSRPACVRCGLHISWKPGQDRTKQAVCGRGRRPGGDPRVGGRRRREWHTNRARLWVGLDGPGRRESGERSAPHDDRYAGRDWRDYRVSREWSRWRCLYHGCRHVGGPPDGALHHGALGTPAGKSAGT